MSQESSEPRATRRQVLRYGGGAAVGAASIFAGCSGSSTQSSGPITNISIEGGMITVNFTRDNGIDNVFLASNGTNSPAPIVDWKDNSTATIGLYTSASDGFDPLPEGNYTVAVQKGNETVDTRRVTLKSKPTVIGIKPEPTKKSDSGFNYTGDLLITLANKGHIPAEIAAIGMSGVPNPYQNEGGIRRISPQEALSRTHPNLPEGFGLMVFPSVKTTFKTTWQPLALRIENYEKYTKDPDGDGYPDVPAPCRTKQWPATLSLMFKQHILNHPFTYSFSGKAKQPSLSHKYLCTGMSASLTSDSTSQNDNENHSSQ